MYIITEQNSEIKVLVSNWFTCTYTANYIVRGNNKKVRVFFINVLGTATSEL